MHSYRSGSGHKGQYVHRTTSQRDEYSERRRDTESTHHNYKYPEDSPSTREHERSPQRSYPKDDVNRDRIRNSSTRRRSPSPDWTTSEKKRRLCLDDYGGRRSPDDRSHHRLVDRVKHSLSQEDNFHYRRSPPRRRHQETELTRTSRHKESTHRRSPECFRDVGSYGSSRGRSPERTSFASSYSNPRGRREVYSPDHHQDPTHPRLKGPYRELLENDLNNYPAVPAKKNASKGFQRFLDVLNKGVNVDTLTRIVKVTTPAEAKSGNALTCKENQLYHTQATPERSIHSPIPKCPQRSSLSFEEGKDICSRGQPGSQLITEKSSLSPEEQHKHRELQHVLQAIGLDLGFDELGQMSHRIQERLYGKKEGESGCKGGKETVGRPPYSPTRHSRSSSSNRPYSQDESCQDVFRAQSDAPGTAEEHTRGTADSSTSNEDFHINKPPQSPDMLHTAIPFITQTPPQTTPATFPPANSNPLFYRPPPFPPPLPFIPPAMGWRPSPPSFSYPPVSQLIVFPQQHPPTHQQANIYQQAQVQPQSSNNYKPQARQRCLQVINIKK